MSAKRGLLQQLDPACEGDSLADVCAEPATCPTCSIWQQSGESEQEWKARLHREFEVNMPAAARCARGHRILGGNVAREGDRARCHTCLNAEQAS